MMGIKGAVTNLINKFIQFYGKDLNLIIASI
jgi:hypothetical protein